ncbi:MAG: hypothetical protein ACOVR6_02415, partial [Fimbriimonas sp.]
MGLHKWAHTNGATQSRASTFKMNIKSILASFVFSWTLVATSLANPQAHGIPVASKTDVSELMSPYR